MRTYLLLWGLLFSIGLGLGYPTLNRYDPSRTAGTIDSRIYAQMVLTGRADVEGPGRNRILVPTLAKPIYRLAQGRVGSWNPAFFGLLAVNAAFCATAAALLVHLGWRMTGQWHVGLLGALLHLLNFDVANFQLSGLVDSAEGCAMIGLVWLLWRNRWRLLPWLGILGTLAKETFLPMALLFAFTWWAAGKRPRNGKPLFWIGLMGISGAAALLSLSAEFRPGTWDDFASHFLYSVTHRGFWYIFAWLIPLGIWRLNRLPRPWVLACAVTGAGTLLAGAYYEAGAGVARPLFHVLGPILTISTALLLAPASPSVQKDQAS